MSITGPVCLTDKKSRMFDWHEVTYVW